MYVTFIFRNGQKDAINQNPLGTLCLTLVSHQISGVNFETHQKRPERPAAFTFLIFLGKLRSIKWWYEKSVERYDSVRRFNSEFTPEKFTGPHMERLVFQPSFCSAPCLIVVRIVKFILFANRGDVCFSLWKEPPLCTEHKSF